MNSQPYPIVPNILDKDVLLGFSVQVLKGVRIVDGAVVATGTVVTQYIPPFEKSGGIPTRNLADRLTHIVITGEDK